MTDTTPQAADQAQTFDPSKQSAALIRDVASKWLAVKLYMETELAKIHPDTNGNLPVAFLEAWQTFGAAMMEHKPEQYALFIEAANALPAELVVPLIHVSAEAEVIPGQFKDQLITELAFRKNNPTATQ